jgi:hypothetical protein
VAEGGTSALRRLLPGHRGALVVFLALFAVVMAPLWLRGEVIAPDRQEAALGLPVTTDAAHPENPLFADYREVYVPEVSALLRAPRSGWLATWDPYNELGRPLYQDAGFSPAYLGTRVLFAFLGDPRRILTALSVLTALAAGLFAFGLAREADLSPVACFVAATGLGLGPPVLFWLAFPMFHAVLAWACGCLYAVARMRRAPGLGAWTLLAFCAYSLLMTGYQQDIVLHAYLLAGYGAVALVRTHRVHGTPAAARLAALCLSAVAAGLLGAVPVYLDLWVRAQESARLALDASFFLPNLPLAGSWAQVQKLLAGVFFQDVFGNPASAGFTWGVGDMSLPPLWAALVLAAAVLRGRRGAGWWVAVLVCAVFTFSHSAYGFAVAHLGLGLSFSNPMYTALIPLAMLAAHGADALVAGDGGQRRRSLAMALAVVVLATTAAWAASLATGAGLAPRWGYVVLAAAVVGGLAVAARWPRHATALLAVGAVVSVWAHGRELLLTQAPERIASTSPLVEDLRRALPPGGRYAFVGELDPLQPNVNATVGLPSVHTYNSLSSRRYQALVEALGGTTSIHGRHNLAIAPHYGAPAAQLAGIAVVGSPRPLAHPALIELPSATPGVHLYRVGTYRGCCVRLPIAAAGPEPRLPPLMTADWDAATLRMDAGDRLELDLAPRPGAGVLVLSRAFHPQWRARGADAGGTHALRTLAADGIFLAGELPAGTRSVTVEFVPYSRLAWIAHVFFVVLAAWLAIRALARRRVRSSPTVPPEPAP